MNLIAMQNFLHRHGNIFLIAISAGIVASILTSLLASWEFILLTGVVLSKHELEELSTVIVESDLYAITDDIYQRITYSEKFAPSIVSLPHMKDRTIVVNGLSKSHSMTGWRIGYVLGPKRLIAEMYKIQQATVGCASSISQKAAITALTVTKVIFTRV